MTEETKQTLAAKELDNKSKQQDKTAVEHKSLKKSPEHFQNVSLETKAVNNLDKLAEKERDNTPQREAVIRPQQAGKIDFKSLQNQSCNRTWPSGKDNPQSPSGKSRNRDKSRKSGKGERGNPQQLYRLSITNPRSNPTIGIAYPQQKVSPPKKIESSRGPVSGSYRFHVPIIPEREAELQQEELQFRCFQDGTPNLTSQSYNSQAIGPTSGGPAHENPPSTPQQQKPNSVKTTTTPGSENVFPDFQLNETDTWPDRNFRNSSFGVTSQKSNNLVNLNKANGNFMSSPFQYGYPLLEESASDSFPCNQNSQPQEYIDISLNPNQVSHNSFTFQSSAESHEVRHTSTQIGSDKIEDKQSYTSHPKPPQYMQTSHGVQPSLTTNDKSSVSSIHQSELSKSVLDKSDSFSPTDSRDKGIAVGENTACNHKNGSTSKRVLIQGNLHHMRNIAQGSSSQIHVISTPNHGIQIGSVALDKSVSKHQSRVSHLWEGPNKPFQQSLIDHTSTPYPFQYQPSADQKQNTGINGRMQWQQIRYTTAMPNQNRVDLSRQLSNQQLTFMRGPSDWQDDNKPNKIISNNSINKPTNKGFSHQRQENAKQGCNAIPPSHFTNKMDKNLNLVGDAKNKSLYFGINHSGTLTSSRNCSYPPLHVAPVGLRMASPYDSPTHSPTQNPTSNSTCSSLSPASTNSINSNTDDSQMSKVLSPQFYHQQQDKAIISSNTLNTRQHHYHSEASRGLHYTQERTKENILSLIPNNRHSKANMDNTKGCLETYRKEQNPPPPYSAHQLSLATANLDQLDVLLTCKQCDQNFNNLASFLDHKQYCGQHTFALNDLKDVPKVEDIRKFQTDHTKAMSSGSSYAVLRSSSDLHLSLLGLNKNGEIVPDNETKGDIKDDPMKLILPSAPLPDLEVEDPKLDSLITEALNGLGYQSDNAEIDSSFIDAFVDDDLTNTKCTSTRQSLTTKDSTMLDGKTNNQLATKAHDRYPFDTNLVSLSSNSKQTNKEPPHESVQNKIKISPHEIQSQESIKLIEWETNKSDKKEQETDYGSKLLLSSKFSARCGLNSLQSSTALVKTCPRSVSLSKGSTAHKPIASEGKRKRNGGGSWSKELIHKIVQQKNKLHKLHVKGTKNMQFSLVMERVTPAVQTPTFREYDYVSDSDEDCEPVKIASQGRLSQSIRCKYTYTKECKGRIHADKCQESSWRQNKNEGFEAKKALDTSPSLMQESPGHQRLRRRSSRSSTSSEVSTSLSLCSDSMSSPKSIDHTDSDSEKRMEIHRKEQESLQPNVYEGSLPIIRQESSTSLALTFTKNTKRYSTDKILLTEHKDGFTTSKCSSIICKTEETASERTMTKSTVSLARFKTTRVEIEEKEDHYGFETGILSTTEEPFKKDYPTEHSNNREPNHDFKLKKYGASKDNHKKETNCSESSGTISEKCSNDHPSSEELKRSSSHQFTEPPLCGSLMDNVCSSPSKIHDASPEKGRPCLMPYPSDHDQSLIKSPLSFDTSSMFGDLSVGGFENNLYPEIQLVKESFSPLESTADKKELFESSFPPFLEQRDWNMMVDVTPVLPDEISQYKDDSDSNENKTNFNQVPFSLPEKLMDYNQNLNSSVSVDDLEIKRIVTELESQLQTAKLSSPPPLDSDLSKQLTMSKFSPLRLDPESEDDDSSLEISCSSDNLPIEPPVESHSALFSDPDLPWTSPLQFGIICGQQGLHTPKHASAINTPIDSDQEDLGFKDSTRLTDYNTENSSLHLAEKTEKDTFLDLSTSQKSEEMLEQKMYTENLMKSLEVISDSLSSGFTSPHLSPNQECGVLEEHEIQSSGHTEFIDDSKKVESGKVEPERVKLSTDTNRCSGRIEELTISDTAGSKPDNVTKASLDDSNATLHNEELVVNEQQLAEDSFESLQNNCFEASSNKTDSENSKDSIYKHNDCDSSHCQTEKAESKTKFDVKDPINFTHRLFLNKPTTLLTYKAISEDLNICEERHKSDVKGSNIAPEPVSEGNDLLSDIIVEETDNPSVTDIQVPLSSIKSPYSEKQFSINSQQVASPKLQSVVQNNINDCSVQKVTAYSSLFPVQSECEDNKQTIDQIPSTITQSPQLSSNSVQRHCERRNNSILGGGLNDFSTGTTALSKNRPVVEDNNSEDINTGTSVDTLDLAATMLNNSFIPKLNSVEMTGRKMSSPSKLLAEDSISKQPLNETSQHSEVLDDSQDKGTLNDVKLSPLNYNETCFHDFNTTSKCLNKGDDLSNIKSSTTDMFILNACALSIERKLPSSPPDNPSESEPNTQKHLNGLDIPDLTIDDNINHNVKFSSIPASCSSCINEVTADDSVQFTKLNLNDINGCRVPFDGCRVPFETIDFMDMHLSLLKKKDSEKLNNHIIPSKHDILLRYTGEDKDKKIKSNDLTYTPFKNKGQGLSQSETNNSTKKGSTQSTGQGKFQCEICALFFRTLHGLKRHKAMKHVVKTEGVLPIENVIMSSQGFMPIYHVAQPMEKDLITSMDVIDPTALPNPNISDILVGQGQQVDQPLIFEGTRSDIGISNNPVNYELNAKANNNVTSSNNNVDISNEIFAPKTIKEDSFSHEILNVLKTDTLQVISPDFPSFVQQSCPTLLEKQGLNSNQSFQEVNVSEEQKNIETIRSKEPKDNSTKGVVYKDDVKTHVHTKAVLYPHHDDSIDIKCENSNSHKDSETPIGTLGMGPDLKNLFDDESTFSQLFPRNDDRKRKRCARVYGKSSKKQKQLPCLTLDYPCSNVLMNKCEQSKENNIFTNDTNDHCEYETISIDDANMLEMSHKTSVQRSTGTSCPLKENLMVHLAGCKKNAESKENGELLCETEDTITQTIVHKDESHELDKEIVSSVSLQDCKPEDSSRPPPYQLVCVQENVSLSPCIDIPNINSKIALPLPFLEPERDMPLVEAIASTEIIDPIRPDTNHIERKSRKRIEPGLKPKDKQYKCKVCFTWFLTLGELDFHKLSHNPSPPPTCYMCVQRKFSSREQLRDHLREKHAKNKAGVWTCGMCLKEISDVWMYNEHLREHATQFARRGQSQSSLLDMPGCFMQENAVKNFISSIMHHRPSRPTKADHVKQSKEQKRFFLDDDSQMPNNTEDFDSRALKNKMNIGGSKHCALTNLEVTPKEETSSKNAEMHPNCKDPSRDCHHCGKQFPKPFKLQRHLVVHSLQKIFLCHKCPVSYQEAKELKDHLKNEHEDSDEPDSKHTTLYTCELCADVMHVIKKSFICSTCNYTFSKKEQFDRHMEKHLAEGNKIFKFRGVLRPRKPFSSRDDKPDMPPSKKIKTTESNLDNAICNTVSLNLDKSIDMQCMKSVFNIIDDIPQSSFDENPTDANTIVKIEDEDLLDAAMTQCLVQKDCNEATLSAKELKEEDNNCSESQANETSKVITIDKEALTEICNVKIEDDCCAIPTTLLLSENLIVDTNIKHSGKTVKKNSSIISENACQQSEMQEPSLCSQVNILPNQDIQGLTPANDFDLSTVKQASSEINQLKPDPTIKESFSVKGNEIQQDSYRVPPSEKSTSGWVKHITAVRSEDNLKQSSESNFRCLNSTDAALSQLRHSSITVENKDTKQKKRKELKTPHSSQRIPSPTTRENLGIDPRGKKKFRSNRCENIDGPRKMDLPNDYLVLTSVKDDTVSNKIVSKNKIGSSDLGPKKSSVDSFSPKKVDIVRHFNGDYKGKRSSPAKPIHSPSSRMATLNNSSNKSRPKTGVRSIETQSHRTAESQNNLLSQLFGPRLTGFKIPLRKDTSESIT